ncbi:phosphotransferase [Demequina sp. TTPB684]|uniref:phosphotransferase n=1 Tax=unclassified Demequina TaxID=2620311 RepID=UPI001CF4AB42|nr:phosphotransferase [Demequina sp. TMPB413]MCB2412066.1 phosphotransferase [Demequina sp. TTPB684]UPU88520.1 phosphotransferase [Demequina sp. TMPB413]
MPRSPLALAALASVAVPGLDVYDVLRSPHSDADFDVVIIKDATGKRWVVRAPRRAAAGAALEAEMGLLQALARAHDAGLIEFDVPRPKGAATMAGEEGGRAVVYTEVRGAPLDLAAIEPGPGLAASVGRAIAQIHELPPTLVEDQGLPTYSADEYRLRRLAELDAGVQTGLVPPRLADRWERQMENVAWWRFEPTVTHGDLGEQQILVREGAVAGIVDWMDARVADPADDLAWLAAAAPEDVYESIMEAYVVTRRETRDPHLTDRARLASELALLRWLMYGVRTDNDNVIADGRGMLADLEALLFDDSQAAPSA